ncbi:MULTISPECIES: MarR family winged helix-turn-helix transcriptional regulator [unclassified Sedimentibacter]|uniref:MarR family winged helix-turn-helix transcriptional regulator n=1 Tax=unclassified Sedimentibacter TaxID=2649220 RepID=UPI0027E0199E|nr:MarR family transcriptional regulator [Sedimentibacter sp. MB35-C1]WMJ77536.1 MarR family transcriptional regulator [Sedimentibacter sp. MB35-C1]
MINQGSEVLRELIRILVRDLGALEKNDASCCGVSLAQCHAIVEIGRKEKISLVDLASLLGLDKSTMSRTINNLVKSNLVIRDIDMENRRYVIIQLTEKGSSVFRNIEESMDEYYKCIFNSIPENKRSQVIESLQLFKEAVESNNCC